MHTAIFHSLESTILYSCSAGIGRTGTLICIDNVLDQIEKEQVVDIAGTINKMRHQRMKMVQTVVSTVKHVVIITLYSIIAVYNNLVLDSFILGLHSWTLILLQVNVIFNMLYTQHFVSIQWNLSIII